MKKVLALTLALLMAMSMMVACNNEPAEEGGDEFVSPAASAVELLNGAYDAFATNLSPEYGMPAEDIKMGFVGGYFSEDPSTMAQGPGAVPTTDGSIISTGLLPEDSVAMIDNASIVMHGMMMNNFVTAAFHVTELENVEAVASALNGSIANNHWMCGQPEGYVVITIGDYVVGIYGLNVNVGAMKAALTATYEGAAIAHEGSFIG